MEQTRSRKSRKKRYSIFGSREATLVALFSCLTTSPKCQALPSGNDLAVIDEAMNQEMSYQTLQERDKATNRILQSTEQKESTTEKPDFIRPYVGSISNGG